MKEEINSLSEGESERVCEHLFSESIEVGQSTMFIALWSLKNISRDKHTETNSNVHRSVLDCTKANS